jgi:magnesium chelatase subunit H
MTQNRTTPAERTPYRVTIVTLDNHLAGAVTRANALLARECPGLVITLHAAADFAADPAALMRCKADIARADVIIATMLFLEDHINAVASDLAARRDNCDALVCAMSAGEIIKLSKLGSFKMDGADKGPLALLKKLRGSGKTASSGSGQMAMLRRLPKILRFIPGPAQDVRAYFLTMQYWLSASDANVVNMARFLVNRYADGPRRAWRGATPARPPEDFPEVGVYHPRLAATARMSESADDLPTPAGAKGVVGLLVLRSYVLADDTGHYDGVIAALEARGLKVIPAFASGLDARPAIEAFFMRDGRACIDALVSLTGFSLVGGPAYNDANAAQEILARLDAPYIAAHPLEFQSLQQWSRSGAGLTPVEATIMVAIPELDGAIAPGVYGGRSDAPGQACQGCTRQCASAGGDTVSRMQPCMERAEALAARVARLVALKRSDRAQRRLAIVVFNFPPNAGAAGTAAYLSVFESLFNALRALAAAGYSVDPPASIEDLREQLLGGNSTRHNTDANVVARVSAEDHIRREPDLAAIEAQWGPAPGRQLTDGRDLFILGARFGNVLVALQPGFGYEGDPMRLMFEAGFAPTHAFSAFYRYLREDFAAHAVLHFGTHGALEFMPGKQVGLSGACWPERLIRDVPNFYLYAANNPSEGAIAKRRSGATLVSHLTPPVIQAGLYRDLADLKASLDRWRGLGPDAQGESASLAALIREQAEALHLIEPATTAGAPALEGLAATVFEYEQSLIPAGLHVLGAPPGAVQRLELLSAMAEARDGPKLNRAAIEAIANGATAPSVERVSGLAPGSARALIAELQTANALLAEDHEIPALIHALDAGYVRPAPGGDVVRMPEVLPTGRNLHGFDPFRIPSAFALRDGARQAARLIERHCADGAAAPETIALVLWGSDNLKTEGGPIAQALALMGARPRLDSYGRICGAELIPLAEHGRARIDVVVTLSGIFRDLLPLQTRMLAEAALLAAGADEPPTMNFIRKHVLDYQAAHGCDLETAALRVFSNADGAYGANVNQLIDSGAWDGEDELADAYEARKCFAYGKNGQAVRQSGLLGALLARVDVAYQNLDCVELGVTTIDHYVDTLGGIARAVRRAKGADAAVYVSDQTAPEGKVRTLAEQVALEAHTRTLNPRWYESLLKHGYEGVRQIEAQVTNTMGWSATTGQVDPWIYQRISETYVLDTDMRARLAELNPKASARMANRLLEAHHRNYWTPDPETLEALRTAGEELEDRLEGVNAAAAA